MHDTLPALTTAATAHTPTAELTLASFLAPTADAATATSAHTPVFSRPHQVAFLHALAASGAVRPSAAHTGVSYRTVYRERRANPAFRRAWDAALLSARALHEDVLAARAIDGVEEKVFYHGEEVATRTRYSDRLLLAHLARLDRLTQDARTRVWSDDFEGALERFAAGEDDPAPVCDACGEALPPPLAQPDPEASGKARCGGEKSSPGLCDKCDKPPVPQGAQPAALSAANDPDPLAEELDEDFDYDDLEALEALRRTRTGRGDGKPKPDNPCPDCAGYCLYEHANLTEDDCQWLGNRSARMAAARPRHAREVWEFDGYDSDDVEVAQLQAFEGGAAKWWNVVAILGDEDAYGDERTVREEETCIDGWIYAPPE